MNADVVVGVIQEILNENRDKVYHIAQTCGGWEIWLQCELAWCFGNADVGVRREVNVWNDARACDLWFEDEYIVELKCLGWNVIQTSKKKSGSFGSTGTSLKDFARRVLEDKKKIDDYKGKGCSIAIIPKFLKGDAEEICKFLLSNNYQIADLVEGFDFAWYNK